MATVLGWRPASWRPASGRPTGPAAARWIVALGSRSAFVKVAGTAEAAGWLRTEAANYEALRGPFLPSYLGWDDDPEHPLLVLEDLSAATWPPPWSARRIEAVLEALTTVRAVRGDAVPARLREMEPLGHRDDWQVVAAEPEPFLRLGLCGPGWLRGHLPVLAAAARAAPLDGDELVHLDVRSDNVCFRDDSVVLIDWNHARLANGDVDVAFWLPSLAAEGGPRPEAILPDAPELAAWAAGFFSARAGLADIPEAPHVRPLQRMQAVTALAWAARALGLPEPLASR